MIVGIMQPYFFPYLGYFQLMKYVDIWVILDRVQFMYPGWINRNRILHPDVRKEWNFITIPLSKRGQFDRICDISIADRKDWRTRLFNKLFVYREAPYYEETSVFVEKCLACPEEKLSAFLKETLASTARKLNITTQILQQGDLEIDPSSVEPGQWALRIARELRASAYVNPPGGIEIYEEANFAASGIDLRFLKPALNAYPQQREKFVPALSIIDVLMWNNFEEVERMLSKDYTVLTKEQLCKDDA